MIYEHLSSDGRVVGLPHKGALRASSIPSDDAETVVERDSWWRTISACIALIRHGQQVINTANEKIATLEARVLQLEEQVTLDELTGLMNRRGFAQAFRSEIDRTDRGHSKGGLLILIDLDNFKVINDTYGHQAGDAALDLVGKTLKSETRAMDACARLGGDEFVLLLANTERDDALSRGQNLIRRLNSLSLIWYGAEIPIRASLGLKDYRKGDVADAIIGDADNLLYNHKRSNKGFASPIESALQ